MRSVCICRARTGSVFSEIDCWRVTRSRTTKLASWSATNLPTGQSTPCTAAGRRSKAANSIQIAATFMITTFLYALVSLDSPATCSLVSSTEIQCSFTHVVAFCVVCNNFVRGYGKGYVTLWCLLRNLGWVILVLFKVGCVRMCGAE